MKKSPVAAQYDSLYETSATVFGGEPVPAVVKLTEYMSGGKVLDIGGGQGQNALYLARQGFAVTVTDVSEVGLAQVAATAAAESLSVTMKVSDVVSDGITGRYDVILNTFVLHHIDTEAAVPVIRMMQAHTVPGGINIITTFLAEGGLYERNQKSGSQRYYPTAAEITSLYSNWEQLFVKERENLSLAKDKAGNRLKNQMIVLIVQKPD